METAAQYQLRRTLTTSASQSSSECLLLNWKKDIAGDFSNRSKFDQVLIIYRKYSDICCSLSKLRTALHWSGDWVQFHSHSPTEGGGGGAGAGRWTGVLGGEPGGARPDTRLRPGLGGQRWPGEEGRGPAVHPAQPHRLDHHRHQSERRNVVHRQVRTVLREEFKNISSVN